jgi:hypothetical protein
MIMAATTTAQRVFELAMGLMGEVNENTGAADTNDNREYKLRTLLILNTLRSELHPFSDNYAPDGGARPVCPVIGSLDAPVGIDDALCEGVLPYGLAAHLLLDENPGMAGFFQQRYEELLARLRNTPGAFAPIESVYGGCEHGQFARW